MKVERMIKSDVDTFQVGDIINLTLSDGEQAQAMAMKQEQDGMIFLLVDCLRDEYRMNTEDSNRGGYDASDLKVSMDGEILDRFPAELRERMVPFENGSLLRLPTEAAAQPHCVPGHERPVGVVLAGKQGQGFRCLFRPCPQLRLCDLHRRFLLLWRSPRFQNQKSLITTPLWGGVEEHRW